MTNNQLPKKFNYGTEDSAKLFGTLDSVLTFLLDYQEPNDIWWFTTRGDHPMTMLTVAFTYKQCGPFYFHFSASPVPLRPGSTGSTGPKRNGFSKISFYHYNNASNTAHYHTSFHADPKKPTYPTLEKFFDAVHDHLDLVVTTNA